MNERYDMIVVGGGPGGCVFAEHAARYGARTAVIEKNQWGGTCTHRGCIPTKALLACSGKLADLKKLQRMGIRAETQGFDFSAMKQHQQQMVRIAHLGVQKSLKEADVHLISGEATIVSPGDIQWTTLEGQSHALRADRVVIAWGAEPQILPGFEVSDRILTSDGLLALQKLPESMAIIGGSVIGVEFATFLAELGVKVTVVEILERLLPNEDEEAADFIARELKRLGVVIHLSTRMESLQQTLQGVSLRASSAERALEIRAEYALLCTGRKPCLRFEEMDRCGIHYDGKGIRVDDMQQTSVPGIYAVGDVTGGLMLAHRAMQQGRALANRLYGDGKIIYDETVVPLVVYSHPNIARVGITEREARERGVAVEVIRTEYAANMMARTELAGQGFVKMLFQQDKLLGATIVGDGACELIAPLSLALSRGLEREALRNWMIAHPTLSEVLGIP